MPRKLRIEYPGAMYHVMNRGDQRENIFKDDVDRQKFLIALGECCLKTEWQIHAYCLMRNHFHLVIETPQPNLVAGMKWLLGVYTKRFNIRHKLCGHLFAGRYKALVVEGSGNGYLRTVCDYVHLNPVRAGLLKPEMPLESFLWSSYPDYLRPGSRRPRWLRVDRLLGKKGIPLDSEAGRRQFANEMERRRAEEGAAEYEQIRRSWFLGSDEFRKELLASVQERVGLNHYGSDRHESGEQKADRIVREELARLGWLPEELPRRPKGDNGKVAMARRLRQETTMSLNWIARRLHMGTWTYVSNLLHQSPSPPTNQAQDLLPLCQ
jgi:REP element-mobilizing transposase RayT